MHPARRLFCHREAGDRPHLATSEYFDDNIDPDQRITLDGNYYVDDSAGSGWKPQVAAGLLLRAGRSLALRFGVESAIRGGSVGVYIVP